MSEQAIRVEGLERRFGRVRAVDGLDLTVPAGSVTGLLGPNGAGKSTTIQILMGLLRRDGGRVSVLGCDPARRDVEIRRRTGFVPEDPRPEPRFTAQGNLDFQRAFRPGWDRELERDLMERLELDGSKSARSLSRGQRAKLALVGALAYRPELLILDDPTSGLDPLARREFIEGILEVLSREGRTVFFSSHQVDDIERVADRVAMIKDGRLLYAAEMEEIRRHWRLIRLSFAGGPAPEPPAIPGLRRWEPDGRAALALLDRYGPESRAALEELEAERETLPLSLEDIYVDLARYGRAEDRR